MDDGSDPALAGPGRTTGTYAAIWAGVTTTTPACNYDASKTIADPAQCNYDTCVGCMDADGSDATLVGSGRTTGQYAAVWAGITAASCTYDGNMTAPDPSQCTYDTCVGCVNPDACDNQGGVPGGLTVGDPSQCDYSCYGCTYEAPLTKHNSGYNAAHTINNTQNNGIPSDPIVSPCTYSGCIFPDENSTTMGVFAGGTAHANYVCTLYPELCTRRNYWV
jgi:hypothetical protein